MPVSRPTAEGLADELSGLYQALERELAAGIAKRLNSGLDAEDWQTKKLAAAGEVRRWIASTVRRLAAPGGRAARRAVEDAFERGAGAAQRELAGDRAPHVAGVQRELPGAQAIDRLAGALAGKLEGAQLQIARAAEDAYRRVVAAPSALALGGALTRRQAAERAWNDLLDQGFTGFVDRAGRKWTAAGYVEMATRTATAQAAVQGHLDRMAELGIDLVIVSDAAQECRLCRPWEGKILTRGPGAAGTIQAESELTGDMVTVHVAGSLSDAIRGGLFHPNCRHSVSAYLPGVTKPIKDTADPDGDKARQQLRYLERESRKWKLREAGALSPEDKARAAAKVKLRQAQIKAHTKQHPDLTRRRDREQIDLGNKRRQGEALPPAPVASPAPTSVAPAPVVPVRPVSIRMRNVEQQRIVEKEYDKHAALAPKTMAELKGIRSGSKAELQAVDPNAVAFYRGGFVREIVMGEDPFSPEALKVTQQCVDAGWWTRCPHDAGGRHTLAHEIGHHIDLDGMHASYKQEGVIELWETAADLLGVARPGTTTTRTGKFRYLTNIEGWFSSHEAAVKKLISEYAGKNKKEMLAEVWAEYVMMGDKARPHIKKLGDIMRRVAEMEDPGS